MRHCIRAWVWVLASALALHRPLALAQTPFNDGLAAGSAANATARGVVTPANAAAVVPGYTATPPEAALASRPSLSTEAQSRLAACAATPGDVNCQALRNAVRSANAPRSPLSPGNAGIAGADRIARDPSLGLGNLASYYSGCRTAEGAAASACPSDVFCLGDNCFSTASVADADFARAMTYLEAARHSGVYLDPARMEVFQGEAGSCRDRLFTNCCKKDVSGRGMTNQSAFGVGTKLVYDVLMNAENREFVSAGLKALLGSAGFSGSFTTYGVTIAINGTALPAGSSVIYSSTAAAGQGVVIAFDPWSLALTVVVFVVLSMMSCNENEGRMALQEGAGLCHEIGTYCSSCIRVLGKCVSCIERTTGKCCFNSLLSRLINEQGRAQIGKGWGDAKHPECSGFTVEQLQTLDFAAMDFSEFYASISPTLPDLDALRSRNASKVSTCYYGAGKCATP